MDVSNDKTATALAAQVDEIASSFGLTADKLVAQTYDGAAVMSGDKHGVQRLVKQRFPKAGFIHCRAHVLNLVLLHSCTNNKRTARFFNTISSLASFFSQSPKRNSKLQEFMETKLPSVCKTKWSYNSRMIKVVDINYDAICACLLEIYMGENEFDADSCTAARGLHGFLMEFNTVFLLKIFAKIFSHTDVLYQILQTKELDIVECVRNVKVCQASIKEDHFSSILKEATIVTAEEKVDMSSCRQLYDAVIEKVSDEMSNRFDGLGEYEYLGLLNYEKFECFNASFPTKMVKMLIQQHSFDEAKLCNELTVLYSRAEFRGLKIKEIILMIVEKSLSQTFSECLRLAKLILTIPNTTASVERSFSVLRRVKNYLRSTMGQKRLFSLMLMAVESELLKDISKHPMFYDDVTNAFAKKCERRIPLLYK